MKKIFLSAILVAAAFSPMVLAAHPNTDLPNESTGINKTESFEAITCSGRCQSCSVENCSRRRRPYEGDK